MISRSSRVLHAALLAVCGAGMVYCPARAQSSFNLQVGQPGYYGQISIGDLHRPPVYDRRPVIIRPPDDRYRWSQAALRPVYLRIPRHQARDWRRYCSTYQACNVPVYFVRDEWYRDVYAPWVKAQAAREDRDRRPWERDQRRRQDRDD